MDDDYSIAREEEADDGRTKTDVHDSWLSRDETFDHGGGHHYITATEQTISTQLHSISLH
jgi:hypothetical protein